MKRGVCDECSERGGSAAHLEVQQFNTRSNEEVRLLVGESGEQEYSPSSPMWEDSTQLYQEQTGDR